MTFTLPVVDGGVRKDAFETAMTNYISGALSDFRDTIQPDFDDNLSAAVGHLRNPGLNPHAFATSAAKAANDSQGLGRGAGKTTLHGPAYVMKAAGSLFTRGAIWIGSDIWEIKAQVARLVDPADPAGHSVQLRLTCMDYRGDPLGDLMLEELPVVGSTDSGLKRSDGLVTLSARISTAEVENVVALPAGTEMVLAEVRTYGEDGETAVLRLSMKDVTEAHGVANYDLAGMLDDLQQARDEAIAAVASRDQRVLPGYGDVASTDLSAAGNVTLLYGLTAGDEGGGDYVKDTGDTLTPHAPPWCLRDLSGARFKPVRAPVLQTPRDLDGIPAGHFPEGHIIVTRDGHSYQVAALDATEGPSDAQYQIETSAGAKLRVVGHEIRPSAYYRAAVMPGITHVDTEMDLAMERAVSCGRPFVGNGRFRRQTSFRVRCANFITQSMVIEKDLDDSPVVIFEGPLNQDGANFRDHVGRIIARQSASPDPDLYPNAHAFVYRNCVTMSFGTLVAGHSAYDHYNDDKVLVGEGVSWGCVWERLESRGCTRGFWRWEFPGGGGHTKNVVHAAYFNGKQIGSNDRLPKAGACIFMDNASGFTFKTCNMEWCERAGGGNFIVIANGTSLLIDAFHPEGLRQTAEGNFAVFQIFNSGAAQRGFVDIRLLKINGWKVEAGNLCLASPSNISEGTMRVGLVEGTLSSSTFANPVCVTDSAGRFRVEVPDDITDYFSLFGAGSGPTSDFLPTMFVGGRAIELRNVIDNPGSEIGLGCAGYVGLTGTPGGSISTVSAVRRAGEDTRYVLLDNRTGGNLTFASSGNVRMPRGSASPVSYPANQMIHAVLDMRGGNTVLQLL